MTIKSVFRLIRNNSNHILTGVAVVGVIGTVVVAVKATPGAHKDLQNFYRDVSESANPDRSISTFDVVKVVWKHYIPAASCGVVTIGAILGANGISTKRNNALIMGSVATEEAYRRYRDKVVETIGEKKEEEVRASINQDLMKENPLPQQLLVEQNGKALCFDKESGQYFFSDMETIRKAVNDVNAEVISEMYASVNDFYRKIGLPTSKYGEEFGFTTDHMLDISFSSVLNEQGVPALCLEFMKSPVKDYYKLGPWQ